MKPLHEAAGAGNLTEVKSLISSGADINEREPDMGLTPLHCACSGGPAGNEGFVEVAAYLIDQGADLNVPAGARMWTPLHRAALQGHIGIARLLADRGVEINAKDRDGATPLDIALAQKYFKVADVIRTYGGRQLYQRPASNIVGGNSLGCIALAVALVVGICAFVVKRLFGS